MHDGACVLGPRAWLFIIVIMLLIEVSCVESHSWMVTVLIPNLFAALVIEIHRIFLCACLWIWLTIGDLGLSFLSLHGGELVGHACACPRRHHSHTNALRQSDLVLGQGLSIWGLLSCSYIIAGGYLVWFSYKWLSRLIFLCLSRWYCAIWALFVLTLFGFFESKLLGVLLSLMYALVMNPGDFQALNLRVEFICGQGRLRVDKRRIWCDGLFDIRCFITIFTCVTGVSASVTRRMRLRCVHYIKILKINYKTSIIWINIRQLCSKIKVSGTCTV